MGITNEDLDTISKKLDSLITKNKNEAWIKLWYSSFFVVMYIF